MGYDSLRIELRYRHIWQTKWAAAANAEAQEQPNTTNGGQSNASRGRRSTSLTRNVHYETEPDPGVDSPVGNKPSLNNGGTGGQGSTGGNSAGAGQPANYGGQQGQGGGSNNRGRHKSYRHYRYY